jgi:hypothetical protein
MGPVAGSPAETCNSRRLQSRVQEFSIALPQRRYEEQKCGLATMAGPHWLMKVTVTGDLPDEFTCRGSRP